MIKKYSIIYADPPWNYDTNLGFQHKKSNPTLVPETHYLTMTQKEICNLRVQELAEENCLLFLWTTSPQMREALEVGNSWGFTYCTVAFVWDKQLTLASNYTISQIEMCLVFRKGSIPKPRGARNVRQFLSEKRTIHSKKPDEVRKRIELMFPTQSKIELFARQKTEGWDVWGNEVMESIDWMKHL